MALLNPQPRPRALLEDLTEETASKLEAFFPTHRRITSDERVEEREWDVLITARPHVKRASHLYVVVFGALSLELPLDEQQEAGLWNLIAGTRLDFSGTTRATEFHVPDDITGMLQTLVRQDLVPLYEKNDETPRLTLPAMWGHVQVDENAVLALVRPFLVLGENAIVAGSFSRSAGWTGRGSTSKEVRGGELWFLPNEVEQHAAWVEAALTAWRLLDPERFPAVPAWWTDPEWATLEQQAARERLKSLREERRRALTRFEREELALTEQVSLSDEQAQQGVARLLTEDGPNLERAVSAAFRQLGYDVEDMDEVHPEGDKREDLRITEAGFNEWEALAEIKGYRKGAAVNDLQRLTRWASRYALEKQKLPSALWHVVNANRGVAPSARPVALPNVDDLANLAAENGLLIDTRALFKAQRDVASDRVSAGEVRANLRTARGRWTYPAQQE